jgi:hypothetical protein
MARRQPQRVVHTERRSRYSGAYAQFGGWGGFPFFGSNYR